MTTDTKNKRQRIDDAQANLERAHAELGAAKGKQLRLLGEIEQSNERVDACSENVAKAEQALQEAIAYRDPQPDPAGKDLLFGGARTELTPNGGAAPAVG